MGMSIGNIEELYHLKSVGQEKDFSILSTIIQTFRTISSSNSKLMANISRTSLTNANLLYKGRIQPRKQYSDGMNLYQTCRTSPVNYIDPDGQYSQFYSTCKMSKKNNFEEYYWFIDVKDTQNVPGYPAGNTIEAIKSIYEKPCDAGTERFIDVKYSNNKGTDSPNWDVTIRTWCAKCEGCCAVKVGPGIYKVENDCRKFTNHEERKIIEHVTRTYQTCRCYD